MDLTRLQIRTICCCWGIEPMGMFSNQFIQKSEGTRFRDFAELVFNEALPNSAVREIEGYLSHKWGLMGNLLPTHPYRSEKPLPSEPSANITILWGNTDGGTNLDMGKTTRFRTDQKGSSKITER